MLHAGKGVVMRLIKSTLGFGKPRRVGNFGGGKGQGSNRGQRGQFASNPRLRWTIPVTTGGCQVSRNRD